MEEKKYEAIVEAILFTMGESVELERMLFYELRNNSAANLFPSFFNVKSPSYFFILL